MILWSGSALFAYAILSVKHSSTITVFTLTLSSLKTNTDTFANSADLDEMAHNETAHNLIWICTVCHSIIDFWLKPLFATMDVTKFGDGKVHFINSGFLVAESLHISSETGGQVHKIICRKENVMPTPTESAPKSICSPPLRCGDITRTYLNFLGTSPA